MHLFGWLRVSLFLALYALLHWAYQSLRESSLDPWFIHTITVQPAAVLIGWLSPFDGVSAVGPRLVWPQGRLTLLAGCDGFEVMSLFIAAMLVADVTWRRGLVMLLAGCAAVWGLNQLRIAALYWAFRYERDWFDAIHTVWGPLLLILCVTVFYLWALRWQPRTERRSV
ncbi:MAG: archaeosortase/exosortase family protein [Methylibium sp.]|nr:archaeosortase/exosortase family protein [Methylibium sp.]